MLWSSCSRARLAVDAAAFGYERLRAGRIALREPEASFRRAALLGFVSSVSFRLRRQGWKNCGEMAGRAYGKTVWSFLPVVFSGLWKRRKYLRCFIRWTMENGR